MQLSDQLGRQPTSEELAAETTLSVSTVNALLQSIQEPVSLDVLLGEAEDYTLGDLQLDSEAADPEEHALAGGGPARTWREILGVLSRRSGRVIENRYGLRDGRVHSLKELAKELNMSREGIRHIETRPSASCATPSAPRRASTDRRPGRIQTADTELPDKAWRQWVINSRTPRTRNGLRGVYSCRLRLPLPFVPLCVSVSLW